MGRRKGKGMVVEGGVKEEGGGERRKRDVGIVFWNVAGLKNKDGEFWKGLENGM